MNTRTTNDSPARTSRSARRVGGILAVGVLGLGLTLGTATTASAHNYVVSTTPGEGETLTELPAEFDINTNDVLLDLSGGGDGFGMQIVDSEGLFYGDGCLTVEGPAMSTTAAAGEPGAYTIIWQAVSADGHTISGELPFTWAPEDDWEADTGRTTPPVCGEVTEEPAQETESPELPAATEEPAEADTDADASESSDDAGSSPLLWIIIAAAVIIVAGAVALLATRRKSTNS